VSAMRPQIRFVTTSDEVRIAYRTIGRGSPLVFVRGWISDLEVMWQDASYRSFFEALARIRLVVQYDARGNGLSDRHVQDLSLDALLLDLEAVVDHLKLDTFDLYGQCFGGPIAVAYTAKHPQRVSSLILDGTYARGQDLARPERQAAIVAMIRSLWPAGVKTLNELTTPEASGEEKHRVSLSEAISREVAVELYSLSFRIDVTDLLPRIQIPTLVMHRTGSHSVRFRLGRELASQISDARFVSLEGTAHNPWEGDARSVLIAIGDFLDAELDLEEPAPAVVPLEAPVIVLLFTDMEGSTTLTQRLGDAKAQEVLRTHNTVVRHALKAHSGSEIKHTGDGIMASFPSASGALECAVTIQTAFSEHNQEHPDATIRVRIGLNAGEPVAEEHDLFGTAVQLAARICSHAEPGQILVSDVVRQLVAGKGLLFSDRGETVLRGFEDPVRLYEVRWAA
jgi:class 3 adenylate cyclase